MEIGCTSQRYKPLKDVVTGRAGSGQSYSDFFDISRKNLSGTSCSAGNSSRTPR